MLVPGLFTSLICGARLSTSLISLWLSKGEGSQKCHRPLRSMTARITFPVPEVAFTRSPISFLTNQPSDSREVMNGAIQRGLPA